MIRRRGGGMMRPAGRAARPLLLALVALIVYSVVGQAAEASPAGPARPESLTSAERAERASEVDPPPNGSCEDIARTVFRPPQTIRHRDIGDPSLVDYGDPLPNEIEDEPDPRFTTTYCWQSATNPPSWDGTWTLRTDNFPYDSSNECVYSRAGETPPNSIPLEEIEDLWPYAGDPGHDSYQRYCRSGATWAAAADAPPTNGECMTVLRYTYKPRERLAADEGPEDVGNEHSISVDPRFETTYCVQDGRWVMTEDGFPYDSPDECIGLYYDDNDHDQQPPPAEIPLDTIDTFGDVDSQGGILGTTTDAGILENYCRNGNSWRRSAQQDDMPAGEWSDWSEECKTIYPLGPGDDLPRKTGRDPFDLGENTRTEDFPIGGVQASRLVTYCRQGDTWYRIDDYPLDEALTEEQRGRLGHPANGTCVVMDQTPPEVLSRLSGPHEWGEYLPLDLWQQENDGEQPPNDKLLCYVAGAWRRGDKLDNVCATNEDLEPEDRADDLGTVWLIPDACWGRYPTSQYELNYDSGGWTDVERKLTGWWTGLFFDLGKGATQISLWSIGWAYDFNIRDYNTLGIELGNDYQSHLLDNDAFKLLELAWFALIAWAGFTALRGKISMAGGEIVMSALLVALSFVLIQNRATYMEAVWHLMDEASFELLVAGMGDAGAPGTGDNGTDSCVEVAMPAPGAGPTDERVAAAVSNMQRQIHCVFVEQPYDHLNWGRPLSGECATKRNQILARGPHGTDDTPRDMMDGGACSRLVEFNEKPTGQRLLGSVITMGASAVMAFLMVSLSLTVVVSKFVALLLFAVAPFMAIFAVAPAGGRRVAWLWASTLFQVTGAVIGSSLLLSGLLLALRRLFLATTDVPLIERFFVMLLLILVISIARKRMLAGGQASAGRFADNMTNFRLGGGGAPWQGAQGSQGVNLLNIDRGLEGARARAGRAATLGAFAVGSAAAFPFLMGGRSYAQRARERRQTRRSFKNLMNVEFAKRALQRPQYTETWRLVKKGEGGGGGVAGIAANAAATAAGAPPGTGTAIAAVARVAGRGASRGPTTRVRRVAGQPRTPRPQALGTGSASASRSVARGGLPPASPATPRAGRPRALPPGGSGGAGRVPGGSPAGPSSPAGPAVSSLGGAARTGPPPAASPMGPASPTGPTSSPGSPGSPAAPSTGGQGRSGPPLAQDLTRRQFISGAGFSGSQTGGPGEAAPRAAAAGPSGGQPTGGGTATPRPGARPDPATPPPRPTPGPSSARPQPATPPYGTPSVPSQPTGGPQPTQQPRGGPQPTQPRPTQPRLGENPAPNDGRPTPPYVAPEGYEWAREYEIATTGNVPDTVGHPLRGRPQDPNETGVLPGGSPVERVLRSFVTRNRPRSTREETRRREEWQRIREWGGDRPGPWPDP